MSDQISWHVQLEVRTGRLDSFRRLTNEMVGCTRREEGVLAYERHLGEDGKSVDIYERYVDSDAAVAHLLVFSEKFGTRFAELVERKRFVVYGDPSQELRALLGKYGAEFFSRLDGFLGVGQH